MKNTTAVGELTELEIATALARAGKKVPRRLSAGLRYNLALDNEDGTFDRVQCKTGILKNGAIEFRVCNADARRPNGVPYRVRSSHSAPSALRPVAPTSCPSPRSQTNPPHGCGCRPHET